MRIFKTYLVITSLLAFLYGCGTISTDSVDVELKPEINSIVEKYKSQLNSEDIIVNANSNDSSNVVHVAVFNAKKFPEYKHDQEHLALVIASKIYQQLINKNNFNSIEIEFVYEIIQTCDPHYSLKRNILYSEIEEFLSEDI